jgi:Tropinone reductase 1
VSGAAGRQLLVACVATLWDGALDGLVNNVGTNVRKPIGEATVEEWDSMVSTNMESAFFLCQAFRPFLDRGVGKAVVNVSSAAGVSSTGTGAIYAMTKAAMGQLSRNLCCEWGSSSGIRVNTVAPWMTMTPLLEAAVAANPAQLDAVGVHTPLGRVAQPAEIAGAIAFMLMPSAGYISGQTLSVDGGLSAQGFVGPCVGT